MHQPKAIQELCRAIDIYPRTLGHGIQYQWSCSGHEQPTKKPSAKAGLWVSIYSNRVETVDHIREALNQFDQQCCLGVWLGF